ncbi:MAG: hypothetical protein EOO11_06260 [Chitinophagaceae bacterium]|nr:MAG: hypothetical protein EOO11_06260 [Chitinophagaceae bacterium]
MALLSFKWFLPFVATLFHPFFVSVTEISHVAKTQEYEVSCKVFAEDLEAAIRKNYNISFDLATKGQEAQHNKYVEDYFRRHLAVSADGKALPLHYLGFEQEKESVYCYFDVSGAPAPHRIDVRNDVLHDFSDKQMNIIHATVNGRRQSTKIDYPVKTASFQF